ncbi:MAG: DNA polymerase III subunit delta, partial [Ktedonobacterales bacterium]
MFLLFHGPDDFSAREELAGVRARHDFGANQDTLSGADVSLAALRSIADTMPFLSEYRLVVVDGLPKRRRKTEQDGAAASSDSTPATDQPEQAPAKPTRGKKAKASGNDPRAFAQGLAEYVADLPPTTVLVVLNDDKLESDSPLVLAAKRHGKERVFTPPQGAGLEQWAENRARGQGAQLSREAAKLLVSATGDNLRLLAQEIDKLATYVGREGLIGEAEIRLLTPSAHVSRVFDLTDALSRRDRKRALALLHELLAAGESPLGIVAMTAYQTRALLQVKTLAERGMRAPQIAQAAGLAPFVVEKSLPLAR